MQIEIPDEVIEVRIELSDSGGILEVLDCMGNMLSIGFDSHEDILTVTNDHRA